MPKKLGPSKKFTSLEAFKKEAKAQARLRPGASLRSVQEELAKAAGFGSYHELTKALPCKKNTKDGQASRGRSLAVPAKPNVYYEEFACSLFKDERSTPLMTRYGYEVPKAPTLKVLRFFSEASDDTPGIFVDGGVAYVVTDSCNGDTVVAYIDSKQLSYLLKKGAVEGNSYGGFKNRAIHDAVPAVAAALAAEFKESGRTDYDSLTQKAKPISEGALRAEAARNRQKTREKTAEEFSSGRAQAKMRDNKDDLIKAEGLSPVRFIGLQEMIRGGWKMNFFGELERGDETISAELAYALEEMKETFAGEKKNQNGHHAVMFSEEALRAGKARAPKSMASMFGGGLDLMDWVPSCAYTTRYFYAPSIFEKL